MATFRLAVAVITFLSLTLHLGCTIKHWNQIILPKEKPTTLLEGGILGMRVPGSLAPVTRSVRPPPSAHVSLFGAARSANKSPCH